MPHLKESATQPFEDTRQWQALVATKAVVVSKSAEDRTPSRLDEGQLLDLEMLGEGDRIQVIEDYTSRYSGVVETSAPFLGIIWIRLEGLGERKLILCTDYRLRQNRTRQWDLTVFSCGA